MKETAGIGSSAGVAWDQLAAGAGPGRPKTIGEAAREFEALLIGQMLRTAREAGSAEGWLGTGEDSSGVSVIEFAEQQFAQVMSKGGGLGLARLVMDGLGPQGARSGSPPKP